MSSLRHLSGGAPVPVLCLPALAISHHLPRAAGKLYPEGLHIWAEEELEQVIRDQRVDKCLLSYSDLPHSKVMLLAGAVPGG